MVSQLPSSSPLPFLLPPPTHTHPLPFYFIEIWCPTPPHISILEIWCHTPPPPTHPPTPPPHTHTSPHIHTPSFLFYINMVSPYPLLFYFIEIWLLPSFLFYRNMVSLTFLLLRCSLQKSSFTDLWGALLLRFSARETAVATLLQVHHCIDIFFVYNILSLL